MACGGFWRAAQEGLAGQDVGQEEWEVHPWRHGLSQAKICLVCALIVAVGMSHVAAAGSLDWPGALVTLVCGGYVVCTIWCARRDNACIRRPSGRAGGDTKDLPPPHCAVPNHMG